MTCVAACVACIYVVCASSRSGHINNQFITIIIPLARRAVRLRLYLDNAAEYIWGHPSIHANVVEDEDTRNSGLTAVHKSSTVFAL